MKTVLAPGAPWYADKTADNKNADLRIKRALPSSVTENFERWLKEIEPIKQGVKDGTRRRSVSRTR
jgi:hypothetical protein